MTAWILIAASILLVLLVSLPLAELMSRRITSFAGQRRRWTNEMARIEARSMRAPPAAGPGI